MRPRSDPKYQDLSILRARTHAYQVGQSGPLLSPTPIRSPKMEASSAFTAVVSMTPNTPAADPGAAGPSMRDRLSLDFATVNRPAGLIVYFATSSLPASFSNCAGDLIFLFHNSS